MYSEVIDGQQRLTTIYIILTARARRYQQTCIFSRKASTQTIEVMSKFEKNKKVEDWGFGEEYDLGIKNGYNFAKEALKEMMGENQVDMD